MGDAASRREFLRQSAAVLGGSWLALNAGTVLAAAERAAERLAAGDPSFANLEPEQARQLAAIADQIYPPDETPGASALGAVHFMDQALGGFMQAAAPLVAAGLEDLSARVAARHPDSADFTALEFDQQTAMLEEIEDTPFFGAVHFLTLCGVFAMPSYGGNREGEGWRQLGFEMRHVWTPPFGHYDAQYGSGADDDRA